MARVLGVATRVAADRTRACEAEALVRCDSIRGTLLSVPTGLSAAMPERPWLRTEVPIDARPIGNPGHDFTLQPSDASRAERKWRGEVPTLYAQIDRASGESCSRLNGGKPKKDIWHLSTPCAFAHVDRVLKR